MVLFLHNNLSFFFIFTLQLLPHFGVFKKKLWWHVHLFGGNPPNMKPLLRLSLKPLFCPSCYGSFNPSSCGGRNFSSKKELDVDIQGSMIIKIDHSF
jgi:hypothetical protein